MEAQALRKSQDVEHQALSMVHQKEEEVQRARHHTDAQPGPPQGSMEEAGFTGCNVQSRDSCSAERTSEHDREIRTQGHLVCVRVECGHPKANGRCRARSNVEHRRSMFMWITVDLAKPDGYTDETYNGRRENSYMGHLCDLVHHVTRHYFLYDSGSPDNHRQAQEAHHAEHGSQEENPRPVQRQCASRMGA